ncbi:MULTISPECIES: hypothetical protein [Cohnella]|uniref:hypothetical protein n=1 Tax=Cohnella TaxID=329857 RepID=UPI001119B324|nr:MULTISPECIES: hypothetical protein [Cohnella]MBN2984396.1 hypothetical protein [Cohnella algarum]
MGWLLAAGVAIIAIGLAATIVIGQSKSNREEDPRYFQQTGRKWLRLGGIYILGIIAVVVLLMLWNG